LSKVIRRAVVCSAVLAISSTSSAAAQSSAKFSGRVVAQGTSQPVAEAVVTIAGVPGSVTTDADGQFTFEPAPAPPFQLVIIMRGGHVAKPITIEKIDQPAVVEVNPLANESVTVVGAAPSIDAAPAAATTMLSQEHLARRSPEHLLQALETIPGVNQVSEGHAAVPAIRGMARGRVLLLIDGARVTSERRVGPSATFLDPSVLDGLDIARGPGSVAYGSDALGGVISVRTKTVQANSPLRVAGTASIGGGIPERRGSVEVSRGFAKGGILFEGHARGADDWDSPEDGGEILNSGWKDGGVLIKGRHHLGAGVLSAGWQSDFGRDVERPRNNSQTVRFYYPYEDSHRFTTAYDLAGEAGFDQIHITGLLGSFEQRTDQDRFATATTGRSIERADVSAHDFHVKGTAERGVGPARIELGLDVNGRYGLEALDIIQAYDLAGNLTRDTTNVSVEDAHRTDLGAFLQADVAVARAVRLSAGVRGDQVTTENSGGYFGDRSTSNGAFSGFASGTFGPVSGFSATAQVSRGFRDPTLSDRYFRGPSGRGFITGNPDLEPETSLQFDLTGRYTTARALVGVSYYHYRIDDLIERYSTQTDFFFFRNRGRGEIQGFEIESRADLGKGYSVELGLNVSRGELQDDGSNLDDISPDAFLALVRKEFGPRAYAQLRMAFLAEDDRAGPSEVAAPGATIFDLAGGYRLTRQLELRGIIRNLLDDSHYASPDPRWVWAPGRSASLTLAVQF
jgi:outer membrane receptor protein involved in Fe transport